MVRAIARDNDGVRRMKRCNRVKCSWGHVSLRTVRATAQQYFNQRFKDVLARAQLKGQQVFFGAREVSDRVLRVPSTRHTGGPIRQSGRI